MKSSSPLSVRQLTRQTNDFTLGPIDLELDSGFTYALLGPNGSGKTTFMKCCMNLLQPTSGELQIFGRIYADEEDDIKEQIAFVPVALEGCEPFTLQNMGTLIHGGYKAWNDSDFRQRAELFQVPLDKPYGRMSEGQRRKTALTLALSTRAPLLLLDEPTNGLDIVSRNRLKEMLLHDQEAMSRTILMATHSIEDIRQFADYIFVIKHGKVIGPFEKDELMASWGRIWIAPDWQTNRHDQPIDFQQVPGIVEWVEQPYPHIITEDRNSTHTYLKQKQIEVVNEQPLALDELLERLLQ